jgi:Flp pilus assembly pilin Flp
LTNLSILGTWLSARLHLGQRDERGANLVEYVLLLTFIALVVIGVVTALGGTITGVFSDADDALTP